MKILDFSKKMWYFIYADFMTENNKSATQDLHCRFGKKSNKINSMRVKSRLLKMLEVPTVQINTV